MSAPLNKETRGEAVNVQTKLPHTEIARLTALMAARRRKNRSQLVRELIASALDRIETEQTGRSA
ncbi:MAG: ribbon-helix-helix protein, CopG family [Streptosporangiaceae bacterium]